MRIRGSIAAKAWSVALAVVLCTSMVPIGAFATDAAQGDAAGGEAQAATGTGESGEDSADSSKAEADSGAKADGKAAKGDSAKEAKEQKGAASGDSGKAASVPEPVAKQQDKDSASSDASAADDAPRWEQAELADSKTKVKVEGVLPSGTGLNVKALDKQERSALDLEFPVGAKMLAWKVSVDGDARPQGEAKVTLPAPDEFAGELVAWRFDEGGATPVKLEGKAKDAAQDAGYKRDYAVKSDRFGTFALVGLPVEGETQQAGESSEPQGQQDTQDTQDTQAAPGPPRPRSRRRPPRWRMQATPWRCRRNPRTTWPTRCVSTTGTTRWAPAPRRFP